MKNTNLHKAKQNKNDEFYTRYEDIDAELSHYSVEYFRDKVIYCPCDVGVEGLDIPRSNFIKYFENNKERLEYKKLIHTSLQEGFDYRSKYCQKLFKEADVVVTNPPFSLFRDFVGNLENHKLKYILWGNNNAITYKEIFPLLKDGKLFLGYIANKTCNFRVGAGYAYDEKETAKINDGNFYGKVPAISVFTNFDLAKHHEELVFTKKYDANAYPKYDNYDAIEVSKVTDIPCDYEGLMGVPITFLNKYNSDQFEIIGFANGNFKSNATDELKKLVKYDGTMKDKGGSPLLNGKLMYPRLLIRRKQQEVQ